MGAAASTRDQTAAVLALRNLSKLEPGQKVDGVEIKKNIGDLYDENTFAFASVKEGTASILAQLAAERLESGGEGLPSRCERCERQVSRASAPSRRERKSSCITGEGSSRGLPRGRPAPVPDPDGGAAPWIFDGAS